MSFEGSILSAPGGYCKCNALVRTVGDGRAFLADVAYCYLQLYCISDILQAGCTYERFA